MSSAPIALSIPLSMPQIEAFCRRWNIAELALFGSVLRDDFDADSDVDVLVTFLPNVHPGLGDHAQMERELVSLFGRKVDLVYRRVIENDPNYLLRRCSRTKLLRQNDAQHP